MGFKWVTHYDESGYMVVGRTKINEETKEQEHYGKGPYEYLGKSTPNAWGGLDHHGVTPLDFRGHTERFGSSDVHVGVSPLDVRSHTEHYDDRDVHTDLDGFPSKGYSKPSGSSGFHEFFKQSGENAGEPGSPPHSEKRGSCDFDSYPGNSSYGGSAYRATPYCSGGGALAGPYRIPRSDSNLNLAILAIVAVTAICLGALAIKRLVLNPFMNWINSDNPPAAVQPSPHGADGQGRGHHSSREGRRQPATISFSSGQPARQTAPSPSHALRANDDGHRGPRVIPDIGERNPVAQQERGAAGHGSASARAGRQGSDKEMGSGLDYTQVYCPNSYVSEAGRTVLRCAMYSQGRAVETAECTPLHGRGSHLCGPMGPNHGYDEIKWSGGRVHSVRSIIPRGLEREDSRRRIRHSGGY